MEWTERQILDTLRIIEESDYDEVKLETDGLKLHVRKSGAPAQLDVRSTPTPAVAPPASHSRSAATQPASKEPTSSVQPSTTRPHAEVVIPPGMVAIRAPMIGTFYRAPAPHLPPFTDVDAIVKAEDTVCLIEVMKLFNTIKAGVAGRILSIHAQNAAPVERDQVLMIIEPTR